MDEQIPSDEAASQSESSSADWLRRHFWLIALVGAILLAAIVALVFALGADDDDPVPTVRDDPVSDLLGWIPANDVTRRAFAVWTPDSGAATPVSGAPLDLIDSLSLSPEPRGWGRSPSWATTFGWSAGQVTSWASAGPNAEVSVLAGDFDEELIAERLDAQSYERSEYRGARLWSPAEGESGSAIGLLNGRLITAVDAGLVRASVDAALYGEGSLADDQTIAGMLQAMAPVSAMTAISQADLAAACDPAAVGPSAENAGLTNYVSVGYGRAGEPSVRRTLVVTTYPDEAAAAAALAPYETGWIAGYANAGGAGGSIDTFGTLTYVTQTGDMLVTEFVDGRDDGWVRSGVRFAIPVCEAALALAPPATPDTGAGQATLATMERLVASLPEGGSAGAFRAVDYAAIALEHPIDAGEPDSIARTLWWDARAPLPPFTVVPDDLTRFAAWAGLLGMPLDAITAVAESRSGTDDAPVGVIIGDWNRQALTTTLSAMGYQWIDLGEVRHFALPIENETGSALTAVAGNGWENIAQIGDRLWVSADQSEMRLAVEAGTSPSAAQSVTTSLWGEALAVVPGATALDVTGAEYLADSCGPVMPGLVAVFAGWQAFAASGEATIGYLTDGSISAGELDTRLAGLRLERSDPDAAGPGTPVPVESVPLSTLFRPIITEPFDSETGAGVTARFEPVSADSTEGVAFFGGTSGACTLATLL